MDGFLLCDEVWDMASDPVACDQDNKQYGLVAEGVAEGLYMINKDDCGNVFSEFVRKELKYMPGSGYSRLLESNHFVASCRLKAIRWLVDSQRRFNLSFGTVFNAANYFDRFLDINQCHGWKHWMMELLTVACLSISCKFCETDPPSLHEIQEGLEFSFEARLAQRMELKILKVLRWELNCTTPHSYIELMALELNSVIKPSCLDGLVSRLTELILVSLLDARLIIFRPCIIAISGLRYILEELHLPNYNDYLSQVADFIPPDQKQTLLKAENFMKDIAVGMCKLESNRHYPSSPDTVLTKNQVNICDGQVDLSFLNDVDVKNDLKRKREEHESRVTKHQRCLD